MDRLADFDELSLDSPLLLKLEVLAKLTLMHMNSLKGRSSVIPAEPKPAYLVSILDKATWAPLDDLGLHFQRDAWGYYERFRNLGSFVLSRDVPSRRDRFRALEYSIERALTQNNHGGGVLPAGASMDDFEEAPEALREQYALLAAAASKGHGMPVFIPDTNVLMDIAVPAAGGAPATLDWNRFAAGQKTLLAVIVIPVIKELDELKRSRDERRKALAQAALSALWGIRSQTRAHRGFEVERDIFVDFLPSEPTEAEMQFLPWLDPARPDHRIIASALDVARRFLQEQVAIVTGDLSMAVLAGFAALRALKLGEAMPPNEP